MKKVSSHTPIKTNLQDTDTLPVGVDRINNINQKEFALYAVGITRQKAYKVLADGLVATKKVAGYDSRGMEVVSEEPDQDKRHKSVEAIMRLFGDSKEFLSVNTQVNNVMDVKSIIEAINSGK